MPIAVDPDAVRRFVLKRERELEPEKRTIFHIANLTPKEVADIQDGSVVLSTTDGSARARNGSSAVRALKLGLKGWENFLDGNGNPVPFETNNSGPTERTLSRLLPKDRIEIANAILEGVSEDEVGNFMRSPLSGGEPSRSDAPSAD